MYSIRALPTGFFSPLLPLRPQREAQSLCVGSLRLVACTRVTTDTATSPPPSSASPPAAPTTCAPTSATTPLSPGAAAVVPDLQPWRSMLNHGAPASSAVASVPLDVLLLARPSPPSPAAASTPGDLLAAHASPLVVGDEVVLSRHDGAAGGRATIPLDEVPARGGVAVRTGVVLAVYWRRPSSAGAPPAPAPLAPAQWANATVAAYPLAMASLTSPVDWVVVLTSAGLTSGAGCIGDDIEEAAEACVARRTGVRVLPGLAECGGGGRGADAMFRLDRDEHGSTSAFAVMRANLLQACVYALWRYLLSLCSKQPSHAFVPHRLVLAKQRVSSRRTDRRTFRG